MSYKLIIFPTPLDARCELISNVNGVVINGRPDTHPSGRKGQSFIIPSDYPNANGAQILISAIGKVPLIQNGRLLLNDGDLLFPWTEGETAAFAADDFRLVDEKVIPTTPPIPLPNPIPSGTAFQKILAVYKTGKYDLRTKEGCGQFTEACCKVLHETESLNWGHIRKTGAQNQYNGHATDAIQLLIPSTMSEAFIYDIIVSSESDVARPGFNVAGPPSPELFYYPPAPL